MPGTRATLDSEWSILLAACSATLPEENQSRLRSLVRQPVRWKSLFGLADQHGTQPLLYQSLLALEDAVPSEEMNWLKQSYQTNVYKNLLLSRELTRILEHLSALGIAVMPYKGLALAEALYGNITLRQAGDIDLIIRPKDLPRIRTAVAELGYTPHAPLSEDEERAYLKSGYECAFDSAAGRNLLEVQWAIQPRFYAVDFEMDGLFERAAAISVAGYPMKTLSSADLLLVLSAHAAKHVWGRLVWLCDIARLMALPNLDWDWITEQAKNLGISRIVSVTMLAANRLLDVAIPAQTRFPRDSAAPALVDEIQSHITSAVPHDVESLSYFRLMMRLRERPADRVRFLGRLIVTPGPSEWQAVRLPRPLFPLYRLVRLSRLAARAVRA
jgi:Uncharacterised nucleotidyltransferase